MNQSGSTHKIVTPPIASNAATKTYEVLWGAIVGVVVEVYDSAGDESSNSADVTITDDLGRVFVNGVTFTGIDSANYIVPVQTFVLPAGTTTDPDGYGYHFLFGQIPTVTIANGTDTDYVVVRLLISHNAG